VKVSTGVGTSVISNGILQRGGRNVAGHIGHVAVPRGAGIRCDCGRTGCVAAIASVPAILTALRANGVPADDSNDIINLVRSGDPVARDAVREAGCALGEILIAAVALVNPEIIAIGGSLAQVSEHLIAGIREVVYARAMPLATENLLIVPSKLGSDAGVIGASMMAVERLFSPAGVTWMLSKAA
ncbi:MAG: ROK family protein, partial [Terrimesophilobacter sp.]